MLGYVRIEQYLNEIISSDRINMLHIIGDTTSTKKTTKKETFNEERKQRRKKQRRKKTTKKETFNEERNHQRRKKPTKKTKLVNDEGFIAILENSSILKVSLQEDKSMLQKRKNHIENSSKDHVF
ncbi:hypothetical protein JTB14_023142 [Gonioctena quinquepunctata]|nr:hypothetical protein JTB14_023142 [Gonioctena quinquepunctata]